MIFRKLKISYLATGKKTSPKLTLSGDWMKKAGFEIGQSVKIEIVKNQLIIKNAD